MKLLTFLFFSVGLFSQQSKSIFFSVGGNYFLQKNYSKEFKPTQQGFSFGVIIPIRSSFAEISYEMYFSRHRTKTVSQFHIDHYDVWDLDYFVRGTNEFLFGKKIMESSNYELYSQFGLGFAVENFNKTLGDGPVLGHVYTKASVKYIPKKEGAVFGYQFSLQDGIYYINTYERKMTFPEIRFAVLVGF